MPPKVGDYCDYISQGYFGYTFDDTAIPGGYSPKNYPCPKGTLLSQCRTSFLNDSNSKVLSLAPIPNLGSLAIGFVPSTKSQLEVCASSPLLTKEVVGKKLQIHCLTLFVQLRNDESY